MRSLALSLSGTAAGGKPTGTDYHPYEVDTTLENGDTWFYKESAGYKSFAELVSIYHASVGRGGNLLMNIAPPTNTTIPEPAMALYKQLGDFVKRCYGDGTYASTTALNSTTHVANTATVTLMIGMAFDRVQLKEDLTQGQLVTGFQILADNKVRLHIRTSTHPPVRVTLIV